ncbi:hypothetical protein ATCC90586_008760 [Pythium insidiosum]|nr:hypothetical protein ATCC90586_008760 [Pythium insidiosum]
MTLFRSGRISRAIALLANTSQPANRYLLALCYFRQNQFVEAEAALLGPDAVVDHASRVALDKVPNGAAGLYLLGRICRRANRRQQAVEFFVMALELDPSLWSAYEELCDLGAEVKPERFFGEDATFIQDEHRVSGWALQQIGRAHFELADYNQAYDAFKELFATEPSRMAGLDVYSTTLWHMKKEVELSFLAQRSTTFDKLSPEAWCVAGNCFSLQKEHDTALSFFQRAIQLDPFFTYAYTLSGHEYVANEDFEKAISCYRHAIRIDPRHYNAWYGLGTIYYRQEKFEFAEYHFRRALEINPRSSLLHCFLGMVLHSTHQFDEALDTLAVAGELQPLNPQARFQRANVLITLHRFDEALRELREVRNFAPRESSVHFMMGKVAKKLGRVEEAMRCFTTALYFHPKDNNVIKAAIDKIHEPDLEDDDRL